MPRAKKTDTLTNAPFEGMEDLPQDPAPRRGPGRPRKTTAAKATPAKRAPRARAGRPPSHATLKLKVRDEAVTYIGMVRLGWGMRCPDCAGSLTDEAIYALADAFVELIAKSDSLLRMAANTGGFGQAVALLNALMPTIRTVWAAHGPGGHGHQDQGEGGMSDADRYPAYAA